MLFFIKILSRRVFTKAMPAGKESDSGNSSNAAHRTTFRPPWVKDGPNPLPTPTAPWTLNKTNRRDSNTDSTSDYNPLGEKNPSGFRSGDPTGRFGECRWKVTFFEISQ